MTITTSAINFLKMEPWCMFANMVSEDNSISGGTSLAFEQSYGIQNKLSKIWANESRTYSGDGFLTLGESYLVDNVYNLVVKNHGYEEINFDGLYAAMVDTKNQMEYCLQKKLVIPFLDYINADNKSDWMEIQKIVKEIFKDTDIDIIIC